MKVTGLGKYAVFLHILKICKILLDTVPNKLTVYTFFVSGIIINQILVLCVTVTFIKISHKLFQISSKYCSHLILKYDAASGNFPSLKPSKYAKITRIFGDIIFTFPSCCKPKHCTSDFAKSVVKSKSLKYVLMMYLTSSYA